MKDKITEISNRVGVSYRITKEDMSILSKLCENDRYSPTSIEEALIHFQKKYNTVILTNKTNKFLKAFNYEEIINSPNGSNQENCYERKSVSNQAEQTSGENQCNDSGSSGTSAGD